MAKRGRKKTCDSEEDFKSAVERYIAECEEQGITPDLEGFKRAFCKKTAGRHKTYTPDELREKVDAYFSKCDAECVFPDWAGMKDFLEVYDDRTYDEWQKGDGDEAKEYKEILTKAAAKRESWLVRVMTSDNKRAQGCLNALKQPQNGGYIDRPQDNGGEIKVTVNLAGVGGENAFK